MAADGKNTEKWICARSWSQYLLLLLFLYALVFRDPLEKAGFSLIRPALDAVTVLGVGAAVWLAVRDRRWRLFVILGAVFLGVYCLSGLAGYRHYQYQSRQVTGMALYDSVSFWIRLCAFGLLFRRFPLKRFAMRLSIHLCAMSSLLVICTAADLLLQIWPRQVYRGGLGSIQLFFGHPSMLAAAASLLLLFLLLLVPYVKPVLGMAALLVLPLYMTLRIRIWGFLAGLLLLVIWLGVLQKKLHLWVILAGIAAGLKVGGRRLYDYYFSPYAMTMARGQFAHNSIEIARKDFPFGTGFATFGSRAAQIWYSPVYYWYKMYRIPGLDPVWPSYACDTFWPMILGESGAAGLAAYIGITVLLAAAVLMQRKKGPWVFIAALGALLFELLESTGTLAFAETTAVGIALLLGLVFGLPVEEEENG